MKRLFVVGIGLLVLGTGALVNGQAVQTSQEFLNSSNKAFEEVILLRTAVAALQKAADAQSAQIELQERLITSEKALNESLQRENKVQAEQIVAYKKITCDKWSLFFVFRRTRCK